MNPDDVVLNFNPGTLVILNVVLGLIMFGIALDTTLEDFKVVARKPKPFVIAILAQLIVLPAVTFGLTLILPVTPSMALGMILVACCPPGNISQVLTHRSGGNVALSVSMTAVSNIIYIFVLPLSIAFWGSLHPTARTLLEAVSLDAWAMLGDILLIIGLPFALGLFIRHRFPAFAKRVQPFVKWFSLLALVGFIVAALERAPERAGEFRRRATSEPWPDLTGGYRYLGLERMSYYVNKDAYRGAVRTATQALRTDAASGGPRRARAAARREVRA